MTSSMPVNVVPSFRVMMEDEIVPLVGEGSWKDEISATRVVLGGRKATGRSQEEPRLDW